jgi:sugar phosphate isomerase/epimerase
LIGLGRQTHYGIEGMKASSVSLASIGIAHFTTIGVAPMDYVAMAARVGYAKVGLRLYPAFPGAPYYEITAGTALMKLMRAQLANTGLSVYDIEFVVIDGAFEPEKLKPVLESAGELGARRLSVCGDDADGPRMLANVVRLADLARPFGVAIDIENMPWRKIATFAQAVQLARESGASNVGALLDALHFTRGGGVPADLKSVPRQLVRSFQLCDTTGPRPATNDALIAEARGGRKRPGQGTLPLAELLEAVPEDCVLSVEVPMTMGTAEDHARMVYEDTQRLALLP